MIDPRLQPLYYLHNFAAAMRWLKGMYSDVLSQEERVFIETFESLPVNAKALLVRLIMRKHDCFRGAKVCYREIGDIATAAAPLVVAGLLDDEPLLTLEELFELLRRDEIDELFRLDAASRGLRKPSLLRSLQPQHLHARTFESWRGCDDERAYRVHAANLCTNLRLMFFGSFRQDWSEFVLADLGIFKYEEIDLGLASRAFRCRPDVETFYALYRCRASLHALAPLEAVLAALPSDPIENAWLEARRSKLLFEIAHRYERSGDCAQALAIYRQSTHPGARLRRIRLLERVGLYGEAVEEATRAYCQPESAAEAQGLERIIPRLYRGAGVDIPTQKLGSIERIHLELSAGDVCVEEAVRAHLAGETGPVFYVENALVTSLFGLLFWDAIFAPVPGAFFHRFHSAPMDLYEAQFASRRQTLVDACFGQLDSDQYITTIRTRFREKEGTVSPFVAWGSIDESMLALALLCIPPIHLRLLFQRILDDIRENCTGLPDLIQFWPEEKRYRLVEVKAPGDRLQDHQQRWVRFCAAHEIPVCVAYVCWTEAHA